MDPIYVILIGISVIVIISYFFNRLAKQIRTPSVLLLITLGLVLQYIDNRWNLGLKKLTTALPLLGTIGVIMIVLEGSLDLELSKDRIKLIRNALFASILVLLLSAVGTAAVIYYLHNNVSVIQAIVYAVPLSVVSSAIIIPSVEQLDEQKREFAIYESTFSDIIGIMFFNYLILNDFSKSSIVSVAGHIVFNIIITLLLSVIFTAFLVYLFQRITTKEKMFFMISVLTLVYVGGKIMHISSLLLILVFGIVLNNIHLFSNVKLISKILDFVQLNQIVRDFKIITAETAFLVRTFFFVIFGLTLDISILLDPEVIIVGTLILIVLYFARWINLLFFLKSDIFPELFLAPRGLVTILLFYWIPEKLLIPNFTTGVFFYVIIVTNILMMIALWFTKTVDYREVELGASPYNEVFDTATKLDNLDLLKTKERETK